MNDKVKINCTFEGNPLPYIKWSKYNETINLNDKRFSIKTNRYEKFYITMYMTHFKICV